MLDKYTPGCLFIDYVYLVDNNTVILSKFLNEII